MCYNDTVIFADGAKGYVSNNFNTSALQHLSYFVTNSSCDSLIFTYLQFYPSSNYTISVKACLGQPYTYLDGHTDSMAMLNDFYEINYANIYGCDSSVIYYFNFYHANINNTVYICYGDSITNSANQIVGPIYTSYLDTLILPTGYGCDSLSIIQYVSTGAIVINKNIFVNYGCNYTFSNGITITNITTISAYTFNAISNIGCDTLFVFQIYIQNPINKYIFVCDSSVITYPDGFTDTMYYTNFTFNNIPTHTIVYPTPNCDSIVIYKAFPLSYMQGYSNFSMPPQIFACTNDTVILNNKSYWSNAWDTSIYIANGGCDSIVYTNIWFYYTTSQIVFTNLCLGNSFTFEDGVTYLNILNDTSHISTFTSANGCANTITHHINISPNYEIQILDTVCTGLQIFSGFPFAINIIADTIFQINLNTSVGCDSNISMIIKVKSPVIKLVYDSICTGVFQAIDGNIFNLSQDSVYTNSYTFSCDTIFKQIVKVYPIFSTNIFDTVCINDLYISPLGTILVFNNDTSFTINLPTQFGCDSIFNINIHVLNNNTSILIDSICFGNQYIMPNGFVIPAIYADTILPYLLMNQLGCDSNIAIHLFVKHIDTSISQSNNVLTANQLNGTYKWINCTTGQIIAGNLSNSFAVIDSSSYACIIQLYNCVDTTSCYTLSATFISNAAKKQAVKLYPNPIFAQNYFTLEYNLEKTSEIKCELSDMTGKKIKIIYCNGKEGKLDIPTSAICNGIYIVSVYANEAFVYKQIVEVIN
jgi:hypothetical protein